MTYPNTVISMPSQLFTMRSSFKAMANGSVYIGEVDTVPTIPTNQIQVYIEQENGTLVPVAQPIKINSAGLLTASGQVQKFVLTNTEYSMTVQNSYGVDEFYFPRVYDQGISAALEVEERLLGPGAKIYRGSNGQYIQNGDSIPSESPIFTHVINLINGAPEILRMSPASSGLISSLSESSATIGGSNVELISINDVKHYKKVSEMLGDATLKKGMKAITHEFNAKVTSKWDIVSSGAGNMSDATLALDNGLFAKLQIENSVVNVLEFGATGVEGEDQTDALQKAWDYGRLINTDKHFVYYLPTYGVYECTGLDVDTSLPARRVIIAGDKPVNINKATVLKFTDTTRSVGMYWDDGFLAYNIMFDFSDARSVGTSASPRWTLDIRNTPNADAEADIDVQFIDCWMQNFHRAIKLTGRGFLWDGGSIVKGGASAQLGCFLELDFPNPLISGDVDQTLVTGMRSYRIQNTRVHGCTGYLVRNQGYNRNNLYGFDFNNIYSDTLMGLIDGAAVNVNVNGGTWLSCAPIFIRGSSGSDFRNVNLSGVNLLGMPEENIGQDKFNGTGTVTQSDVNANAQGTIVYVPADAGIVEGYNHIGGIVRDVFSDCFQFNKAILGFNFDATVLNFCKENRLNGNTERFFFNGFATTSDAIKIKGFFKALPGAARQTQLINCPNATSYDLSGAIISGNARESSDRPSATNFGGIAGPSYCGTYTGNGAGSVQREITVSTKRNAHSVTVVQTSGAGVGTVWHAIEGRNPTAAYPIGLSRGTILVYTDTNLSGVTYDYTLNF